MDVNRNSECEINDKTVVSSNFFDKKSDANFAIAIVALDSKPINNRDNEFRGALALRSEVYLEKGWLKEGDINQDGLENDLDDDRSVHFVVAENIARAGLAKIIGNMRLIVKKKDSTKLPIEEFYPDIFKDPAPTNSVEVSRLISRHSNKRAQAALKWPMFYSSLNYVEKNKLGPVYGVVEESLAKSLSLQGVSVEALADPKYISDINANKQPITIGVSELNQKFSIPGGMGECFGYDEDIIYIYQNAIRKILEISLKEITKRG